MNIIRTRVGLQQRILPEYRVEFFDRLAITCLQGLSVFAGDPRPEEAVETARGLAIANFAHARNLHLGSGKPMPTGSSVSGPGCAAGSLAC